MRCQLAESEGPEQLSSEQETRRSLPGLEMPAALDVSTGKSVAQIEDTRLHGLHGLFCAASRNNYLPLQSAVLGSRTQLCQIDIACDALIVENVLLQIPCQDIIEGNTNKALCASPWFVLVCALTHSLTTSLYRVALFNSRVKPSRPSHRSRGLRCQKAVTERAAKQTKDSEVNRPIDSSRWRPRARPRGHLGKRIACVLTVATLTDVAGTRQGPSSAGLRNESVTLAMRRFNEKM